MASNEIHRSTAVDLLRLLQTRACSAREVTASLLAGIDRLEPALHAFVDVDHEGALRRAVELDEGDGGRDRGPLHGLPVAIKETIDVAGLRCTLGTSIHGARRPARDATVVQRLRDAGAIIVGTTVSTEYAIARAGPTRNPHDYARTPGGSSSGSAAAVAAGMVPIAIGTQTVGSIVRPAVYCGIFGLKPTMGAIDTGGVMPLSPFLDHVGPMARTAADIALVREAMLDPGTSRDHAVFSGPKIEPAPRFEGRVLRLEGPLRERVEAPSIAAMDRAQAVFEASGMRVDRASLPPRFDHAVSCYETILFRDIAAHHGRDRDLHGDAMSARLRDIIDQGRAVSDRAYAAALSNAEDYRRGILDLLAPDTIILAAATDSFAPVFSEETGPSRLQGLWTLAGVPALAVPCGSVDALPVGVQLIAAPGREALLFGAGHLFKVEPPAAGGIPS